ncbi:MAG: hypothetical protein GEU79_04035 [Acidimicrobiia bacterium]|nr:hypothetical protein [Acidimicrobiia bacterium]
MTTVDFSHPPANPPTQDPTAVAAGLVPWSKHLVVAGRTVWTVPPPKEGIFILQPNRFGYFEDLEAIEELGVPVTVMIRPDLVGWVPLPERLTSVLTTDGRPVTTTASRTEAERLADLTDAMESRLGQIRGIRMLPGEPLGTVSFLLSTATKAVLGAFASRGVLISDPQPPLPTMSLTIHPGHNLAQVVAATAIVDSAMDGLEPPEMPEGGPGETPPRRRTLEYHPIP